MLYLLLITIVFIAYGLTGLIRYYALKKQIMDIPNHRSAHSVPTPRGGGVAFVMTLLFSVPCIQWLGYLTPVGSLALVCAGVFVATLGFLDDYGHLSVKSRLFGHSLAAILALYWIKGFPVIHLLDWTLSNSILMNIFGFFYFVWLINLYNFMDGIDGLAGAEAICVCLSAALIDGLCGDPGLMVLPLFLAACVTGFLIWNWPPAKIFMGDAGSGFLGFILAVLSLQATHMYAQLFWSWLILLAIFITDATYTLLRRAIQKDKIHEAHSTHAYQHASRRFQAHLPVTLGLILINVFWLLPLAVLVALEILNGFCGVLIAYTPLILGVAYLGAGKKAEGRLLSESVS